MLMNERINKFILAKISCLVGKHMGSEVHVSGAQTLALHLLAVASGKDRLFHLPHWLEWSWISIT